MADISSSSKDVSQSKKASPRKSSDNKSESKKDRSGTSRKAPNGENSAADRSLGLTPGSDNSNNPGNRGIPKPISSKDARNAGQVLKPQRAPVEGKDRALPGGKGEVKNPKSKKLTAREKALQAEAAKQSKRKRRTKKRTALEKLLISFGFSVGKVVLTDPKAVEAANALRLRPWHLRRLKMKFDAIDIDGSGNIDADEFFEAVGEVRTPFTDKLFAMIDLDGSGTIEFDEFVRVLATYCMFTQEEILRFCFQCFDVDGSGSIDEREFVELCKTVNNAAPMFPSNFKAALEQFDVNEDGLIDYNEFLEIDRRFPMVLFPAFRLQDFMQKNTLGEHTWLKIVEEFTHHKTIEEFKAQHGGRAPPEPILTKIGKTIMPCFYREREHIKIGFQ